MSIHLDELLRRLYKPRTFTTTSIALSNTGTESQIPVPEGAMNFTMRLRATGNTFRVAGSSGGTSSSRGLPVLSGEAMTLVGPLKATTLYVDPSASGLTM